MGALRAGRRTLAVFLFGAGLISGAAAAETPIKFSLDFKLEGPAAPFLLPLDRGYYKSEGVNVTIEAAVDSPSRSTGSPRATTTWASPTSTR